jgi:hypothetical protein
MSAEREHHAVVQVGNVETGYRRAGRGPSILLLTTAEPDTDNDLFTALAAHFRVIQPAWPAGVPAAEVPGWLRGIIEGLGLERPLLLVDAGSEAGAHELSAMLPSLVGAVVSSRADVVELTRAVHAAGIMVDS